MHEIEPCRPEGAVCEGTASSSKMYYALGLLQEKWLLFIVRVLLDGPLGFNEMSRAAGSVNATTLAQRLTRLEQAGLLTKTVHSTMPPRTGYQLTDAGLALRPVLEAIAAWGDRYLPERPPPCGEGDR